MIGYFEKYDLRLKTLRLVYSQRGMTVAQDDRLLSVKGLRRSLKKL
ncbi:MAG: hypothetical protein HY785_29160 [Oscillatoriophycideae cyanobacterium NC_groundwater_1537_Pr4_S-0.65um_50_18]|nr:hypothetical protein [Oscillatoriophycideae cyanobacterium NC_groundwater_1537_Pr4_S-0.65um_50_18]